MNENASVLFSLLLPCMKSVLTMGNNGSKKRNKTFEKFKTEREEGKGFFFTCSKIAKGFVITITQQVGACFIYTLSFFTSLYIFSMS